MQSKTGVNDIIINPFVFCVHIASKKEEWEGAPDSVQCPICITYLDKPIALKCGHMYCKTCIERWKRRTSAPKCPMCRADISNEDTQTVHQGVQRCIDYLRIEKEDSGLFRCSKCSEECDVPNVRPNGETVCGACSVDAESQTGTVEKIVSDVLERKTKKRKRV